MDQLASILVPQDSGEWIAYRNATVIVMQYVIRLMVIAYVLHTDWVNIAQKLVLKIDGVKTVNTCVYVTMEALVIEILGHVFAHLDT
ncbi:hypothetical protein SK128_022458 [Halocaridina rubra]|uniref:Uncharacterized protein n=1 Tax=Halocaridina rubra TaxID=373956 RepID=A0AAN8WLG5_HALRR